MPDLEARLRVATIGHSTARIEDFLEVLCVHRIEQLVDVRTIPRSRHNPQFNRESLPASLKSGGISYRHMPGLGGLRRPRPDSINSGWRNSGFRGFADYMQTPEFAASLEDLIGSASGSRVAIMCAEAVPWRCHRSLIADALTVRGIPVVDILGVAEARTHELTPFAKVDGVQITYPGKTGLRKGPENSQLEFDDLRGLS